jgi:hypothetical protein
MDGGSSLLDFLFRLTRQRHWAVFLGNKIEPTCRGRQMQEKDYIYRKRRMDGPFISCRV